MSRRGGKAEESLAGSLLLAHPALKHPNFHRSVVFLASHDAGGAMGVIVNRPLGRSLGDVQDSFAGGPLSDMPLFSGGPVQPSELIVTGWRTKGTGFQMLLGMDMGKAAEALAGNGLHLRGMLGYAGWSGGQLESELAANSWIVARPPSDLFQDPDYPSLWRKILERQGDSWKLLADEPEDPEAN
jgi:putative transcriptional regulator